MITQTVARKIRLSDYALAFIVTTVFVVAEIRNLQAKVREEAAAA